MRLQEYSAGKPVESGVWQNFQNTSLGYGLVQWDDATKFLNWANLDASKADNLKMILKS